jgi:DNA polymerase epsilon subunit 3
VFVNYLTSTYVSPPLPSIPLPKSNIHSAAEHAARTGKKTVMPKDVFDAMTELEFSAFLPRLEAEVGKFTSIQADKRNSYRKKVREDKKAAKGDAPAESPLAQVTGVNGVANGHRDGDVESPPTKRIRRESGDEVAHGTGSEEEGDVDETGVEEPDEEVEEDEIEEEVVDEGLMEDPLEDRTTDPSDDEMVDGDESD